MSHSPETSPDPHKSPPAGTKSGPTSEFGLWRLWLWKATQRFLVYYLGIVLLLSLIQRSLMYVPTRVDSLPVARSKMPHGNGEDISFRSADGLQLHGWHFLPAGRTAVNAADFESKLADGSEFVVLFFHGNGGNRLHRVPDYQLLTRLGVHVVAFDYRGYGENAGSPTEEKLAADSVAAWKYLVDTRHVGPSRILIYGESLGGGVATRLAAEMCEAQTPPGGLILCSTFSSMVDAASYHYPWLPVGAILKDRFHSDKCISRMTAPLLMLHGQQDRIVPYRLGRRLFDIAPAESDSGIPKTLVDLPRADHNDILLTEEIRFRDGINAFLKSLRH